MLPCEMKDLLQHLNNFGSFISSEWSELLSQKLEHGQPVSTTANQISILHSKRKTSLIRTNRPQDFSSLVSDLKLQQYINRKDCESPPQQTLSAVARGLLKRTQTLEPSASATQQNILISAVCYCKICPYPPMNPCHFPFRPIQLLRPQLAQVIGALNTRGEAPHGRRSIEP